MVPPQLTDTGFQQSSTATGASRPLRHHVPNGDNTITPHPSVPSVPNGDNTTTPDPSVTHQVKFADSVEYPQGKTRLPSSFCLQCLACHPFRTKERTYHIRPFRENLAMHQAISLGKLPKVDPWKDLVKAFKPPSPKPTPEPAREQQGLCTGTFALSEAMDRYYRGAIEGLSAIEKAQVLNELLDHEDCAIEKRKHLAMQAQQAPAAHQFASYATAANTGGYYSHYPLPPQPTGPPTKKKRKASNTNEVSGRADKGARFGGAHTATIQGARSQRANAAQTPQPKATPASNPVQRQRASSNPLNKVERTGQPKALETTNVPKTVTATKIPAKGEATAATQTADRDVLQKAVIDEVIANIKASKQSI